METQLPLLPCPPRYSPSTIHINGVCNYREEGDVRVLFANGIPILLYSIGDLAMERFAMIHLTKSGLASQQEVAAAFGCSRLTIFRCQKIYDQGGIEALVPAKRGPKDGSKVKGAVAKRILALKKEGLSNSAIGVRLGLKEDTVCKALKRLGWSHPNAATVMELPLTQEEAIPDLQMQPKESTTPPSAGTDLLENVLEPEVLIDAPATEPISCDPDPSNRILDRTFARLGLLDDAAPIFENATNVAHVGVLLAVPSLTKSGIFFVVKTIYGSLGASFYGLRTIVLTLLFMALLRIKQSESLKEYSPLSLGRVMGLDRACEVKTLRRKLTRLASFGKASFLGQKLAQIHLKQRDETIGFLYVDGHVRVYHGKRKIPKAYVTQRRLAMPAALDYWVNDQQGDPLFVVTSPANEGLVAMLPSILEEIRSLIGDQRTLTIVFDRGGWSPQLFCKIIEQGFHFVTYRKGKIEPIDEDHFLLMHEQIDDKRIEYLLHDRSVSFFNGKFWLRQVTRLNPTGHQTHIITSRQDLSPVTIAYRMFERWRQENFFKYMREEFSLDALVDYTAEEDDAERLVPNPERKKIIRERKKIKAEMAKLERRYGLEALNNHESQQRSTNDFTFAESQLFLDIKALEKKDCDLKSLLAATPDRIPLKDTLNSGDNAFRLSREKKHFTDLIKMVAYQAESDLFALIQPYYARAQDEGRTLIQSAFSSMGSLEVIDGELRVTLNPLSSPHRSRVIKDMCRELNNMKQIFPGSNLRLVYDVKEQGHVTQI